MTADDTDASYLKTLSVLYVEDEADIRDQLTHFLKRRCAAVYTAADGADGLSAFKRYEPDIVVSDILMPVMDGLKMGAGIRELNPATPLIITTAFEEPEYFRKAIDLGVTHYVTKPVPPEQLLQALLKAARIVQSERALREVEERYGLLFRVSDTALAVFDAPVTLTAAGAETLPEDWRLLDCNPAFRRLLGLAGEELPRECLRQLISEEGCHEIRERTRREMMPSGFTSEFQLELLDASGVSRRVIAQLLLRRDRDGGVLEALAVMHGASEIL